MWKLLTYKFKSWRSVKTAFKFRLDFIIGKIQLIEGKEYRITRFIEPLVPVVTEIKN